MLFEHEGELVLSVLCGSVATYSRDIKLSESEVRDYSSDGREAMESLAAEIRMNPTSYSDRHIKSFHQNLAATQAAMDSRAKNCGKS